MKAPYNFVPLNEKVFFPDWLDKVSQEYPFRENVSGIIDIEIEALSPIFIKHAKEYNENEVMEFCHYIDENGNKKYYIPGSSVKGMIRSVLEILSFAKLNFFDDKKYFFRDLNNKEYISKLKDIRGGWLYKENGEYKIKDAGIPGRIDIKKIDDYFNTDFYEKITDNQNVKNFKSAKSKYEYFYSKGYNEKDLKKGFLHIEDKNGKKLYDIYDNSQQRGTIVFTGQPGIRKEGDRPSGKRYEFIFFERDNPRIYKIDDKLMEHFRFAYFEGKEKQPKESEDWKYWREKLEKGEDVPVFFKVENDKVIHFGLSYLYKLPYENSIKNGLYSDHLQDTLDLAEIIFGIESNEKENKGLKGRVIFSHLEGFEYEEDNVKEEILATPRASYYPIYLSQNCNNGRVDNYKTYNDDNFVIAGRKRYPIRNNIFSTNPTPEQSNVTTKFKPLKSGAKFKGKMVYHNLKKEELGAILSAITFHLTEECFHNIGMAKPLGYGKIKIKINGIDAKEYIKEFEKTMTKFKPDWIESDELIELFTMAKPHNFNDTYMELNDFRTEKSAKHCLKRFSAIVGERIYPNSLLSDEEKKALLKEKEAEKIYEKEKLKVSDILKRSKNLNNKQDIKNIISQIDNLQKNIVFDDLKKILENIKSELLNQIKEIEKNEFLIKMKKLEEEIEKLIQTKNIKKLNEFLDKDISEELKNKIKEFLDSFKSKKSDFIEEIKKANNTKRIQSLIGGKNYKLNEDEINALIEKIKEIYPQLKSKEKKSFFKKVKISKISVSLEEKIKNILEELNK